MFCVHLNRRLMSVLDVHSFLINLFLDCRLKLWYNKDLQILSFLHPVFFSSSSLACSFFSFQDLSWQCTQFPVLRTLEQTSDVSFGCTQACCKIMAFCKERKTSRFILLLKGDHYFLFRGGGWEQRGPLFVTDLQKDKIPENPLREREWRRPVLSYPTPKNPKFQKFFFEKKNGGVLSAGQGHGNQVFKEVAELSDTKQQKGHNRAIQSDGWLPRAKTTNAGNSGG